MAWSISSGEKTDTQFCTTAASDNAESVIKLQCQDHDTNQLWSTNRAAIRKLLVSKTKQEPFRYPDRKGVRR